jgi:hypothetical protein
MHYLFSDRYCRLCQRAYKPGRDIGRDGFCCDWCRITLHRFIKKLEAQGRLPRTEKIEKNP